MGFIFFIFLKLLVKLNLFSYDYHLYFSYCEMLFMSFAYFSIFLSTILYVFYLLNEFQISSYSFWFVILLCDGFY